MITSINEKNIFDTIASAKDEYKERKKNHPEYLGGSISRYAKNLIMTFPLLADDSLPISTIQMISKASERNITTMLQMLFSSLSITGDNGKEILAKVHKNIDSMSMDDVIDAIDSYCANENIYKYNESSMQKVYDREAIQEMVKQLPEIMKEYPLSSFSEKSLNDYLVRSNNYSDSVVYESLPIDPNIAALNTEDDAHKRDQDISKNKSDYGKNRTEYLQKQLINQDIKKANELQPTLLSINMVDVDEKSGRVKNTISFAAGVKSRIIGIEAMDVVERIVAKVKTALNFKNFIRATSGEIKFGRDFLLCIKQAKINAKNAVKKGEAAQIWNALENRAANNVKNKYEVKNDASAISTLVINQETVNYIKNSFKIDLNSAKEAVNIMKQYNLLALVIADESNEVAKFLYDGNNSYELVAYASLSRDMNDTSTYKKTVNLINQAGR